MRSSFSSSEIGGKKRLGKDIEEYRNDEKRKGSQ